MPQPADHVRTELPLLASPHRGCWRLLALDLFQYQVIWRVLVVVVLELLRTRIALWGTLDRLVLRIEVQLSMLIAFCLSYGV